MSPGPPQPLIAVVEDDKAVLNSLRFCLEVEGYGVCSFETCAEALASAAIDGADCLVIDFALPDMDGIDLMHALRLRRAGWPAVIIAGDPTRRCRREAEAAGAPLVEKPLLGEALIRQVQ